MSFSTISEMFHQTCDKHGDSKVAFRYKFQNEWQTVSHKELREKVESFAIGLMELGIVKGDRVGIVSENRIEWIIASFAVSIIGAVDVPIFPILTAKQEEYIFNDCSATAIIVSNNFQLNKVLEFKDNINSLRHIVVMNKDFKAQDLSIKSMDSLMQRGAAIRTDEDRGAILKNCCSKITENDLVSIIYTSGTTGNPKGVMLTNKNFVSNIKGCLNALGDLSQDITLSYLPFCHAFERTTGFYTLFAAGSFVSLAESIETVASNMKDIKPTLMTTVPKLLETIHKKILLAMDKEKPSKKKIFNWAVNIGVKYAKLAPKGKVSPLLATKYKLADKLVFSKLREKMGGRLSRMVCGGAPLSAELAEFFFAIGVNVYEGYGLTEASPVVTINRIGNNEFGTIGQPLDNVEVRLADDGEILVKGDNVMKGYWNDELATQEAIDPEGWLYTGDVAVYTDRGNIKITDRKKYIFVSSGGKNIAPQSIETLLTQSRFIDHCVLIGERREYCTALLSPNFEQLKLLAADFGISYQNEDELTSNPKIISYIKKDLDHLQKDLSKFEKVRKFSLLGKPFSTETGELSPKMSIKRHIVERNYADIIEKMYNEG